MTYADTKKPDGFYIQFARIVSPDLSPWLGTADDEPKFHLSVHAEARCMVVASGVGTHVTLRSPGMYGVGVDSLIDPYLDEMYEEQRTELLAILAAMHDPVIEEDADE